MRVYTDGLELNKVDVWLNSNEDKPTVGYAAGSILIETDTGKVYFYDEEESDWKYQFTFKEE